MQLSFDSARVTEIKKKRKLFFKNVFQCKLIKILTNKIRSDIVKIHFRLFYL